MTKTEMTSRERVLTAARRQTPDRVPRDIPLEKFMLNLLKEHYGTQDLLTAMRSDIAIVDLVPTNLNHDYSSYFSHPGVTWDEWGRGRIRISARPYHHLSRSLCACFCFGRC